MKTRGLYIFRALTQIVNSTLQCLMRVAIFNQKGGVGKTTTTLNLAAALCRDGRHPLLIDMDPQCHLSMIRGITPEDSKRSLLGFFQGARALHDIAIPWEKIGRLIPAHQQLMKVDSLFSNEPDILGRLRNGLDEADQSIPGNAAQTTLIDCCPYVGILALNAIFACNALIVPVSTDYMSLQAAEHMARTLEVLEPVLKRRVKRRYLLTRFDRRRKMSEEIHARLIDRYGDEVCKTVISENSSVAESPAHNTDVFSQNARSVGARDYFALYQELRDQQIL